MRRALIITADDFGAALAVNEAVEIAHTAGILTAASLMVAGEAAAEAVERARRLSTLGVGLHVVLADGRPVLPVGEVPALVGPDGCFAGMIRTAFAIALWPPARAQMRAEVAAQFAAFAATGLRLDHVNAHKHFHLHPLIASAILDAGRAHGLRAQGSVSMRVPVEPGGRGIAEGLMRWWAGRLGRRLRRAGIAEHDRVAGLAATGAFDTARMLAAITSLPEGITELYCHPATEDIWPGCAPGYRYRDELAALTAPDVLAALEACGAEHGDFRRVLNSPQSAATGLPRPLAA
jgi:hopanoid biosynthesis associated protein HpnK